MQANNNNHWLLLRVCSEGHLNDPALLSLMLLEPAATRHASVVPHCVVSAQVQLGRPASDRDC